MMIIQNDVSYLPFGKNSIDMIFSDPPYVKDQIVTYQWLANEAARILKPGKFIAVMCGGEYLNKIIRWFDESGLDFYWLYQLKMKGSAAGIVWKNGNQQVPIQIRIKHILVYSNGSALARTPTVGLYNAGRKDKIWHHWGQDIDSHRYYIDCFSAEGDLVIDPMCGGGTTAEACKLLNRRCIIGDIDPTALLTSRQRIAGNNVQRYPLFAEIE